MAGPAIIYKGTYDGIERNLSLTGWLDHIPYSRPTVNKYIRIVKESEHPEGRPYHDDEILTEALKMADKMNEKLNAGKDKPISDFELDKVEAKKRKLYGDVIRKALSMSWGITTAHRR